MKVSTERILSIVALLTVSWASAPQAQVTQQPLRGMVYSDSKPAAIAYECAGTSGALIKCELTELDVWKWRGPSLDQMLSTSGPALTPQQCLEAKRLLEADAQASSPEQSEARKRDDHHENALEVARATHETCTTGRTDARREFIIRQHERLRRTCTYAAHTYQQTFRRMPRGANGQLLWVTDGAPSGTCGILRQSRFIGAKNGDGDTIEWSYVTRIEALNKSAEDGPMRCSDVREIEATYTWRHAKVMQADCETIQFMGPCYSPDFPCLSDGPSVVY